VIEPPSKQLRETLLRLKICSPADFRRCKRRVRRLARDLPAFDFVWIDALLQARRITPFQARILESGRAEQLCVGPCLLLERLGQGEASSTYLARQRESNERCVVKVLEPPAESLPSSRSALEELTHQLAGWSHPSLVAPHAVVEEGKSLVLQSRYVPGPHLGELLIRRGRFPATVVIEIARQLADGLAELEARGAVHGDLSLSNVRLTSAGAVVLVDAGVRPAVHPELIIQAHRHPARYDGIAPERIGTGNRATVASDMYAFGCLLWHLLAGRPPFTTGDPLGKLASHQTRPIPDVREWAPDTPAALAETILALTRQDAGERPASFRELRESWGPPRRAGRKHLARFQATFETEAPGAGLAAAGSGWSWTFLVALLFVFSGAALALVDRGAGTSLLRLPGQLGKTLGLPVRDADASPNSPAKGADETDAAQARRRGKPDGAIQLAGGVRPARAALPSPDPLGVVRLQPGVEYEAESITSVGPLVIQGSSESPATIVVTSRPVQLDARELTLQNVRFHWDPIPGAPQKTPLGALVLVQSQELTIVDCEFVVRPPGQQANRRVAGRVFSVAWRRLDPIDRSAGRVSVHGSVFVGGDGAIHSVSTPRSLDMSNCLLLGGSGALVSIATDIPAGREFPISLRNVTLRGAEALLRLRIPDDSRKFGRVALVADDSVMHLEGANAALFQIIGEQSPDVFPRLITMTGQGSLADADVRVARWLHKGSPKADPFEPQTIEVEGVAATPFQFVGPATARPADSAIDPSSYQAPRTGRPPGIVSAELDGKPAAVVPASASEDAGPVLLER